MTVTQAPAQAGTERAAETVLELSRVSFAYNSEPVLRDVSLSVPRGSFLGLVGPNGSGKTTLLRIILGLLEPAAGGVRLFGQDRRRFRQWHRVGYVPQKATAAAGGGFPATVAEVVQTGRIAGRGLLRRLGADDRAASASALELVGMGAHARRSLGDLSGGQQQRVFIARALASRPDLLILDEPTVGVDVQAQEQFYALLHRLRRELDMTVVLVSHDIGVVAAEVSHVACLNRSLFYHGEPAGLHSHDLCELYGHHVTIVSHRH